MSVKYSMIGSIFKVYLIMESRAVGGLRLSLKMDRICVYKAVILPIQYLTLLRMEIFL